MSAAAPIVVVAGLGRCGSSLMMQMLDAGGLRCAGPFPAYEPEEVNHRPVDALWLAQWQAVKILDPHLTSLPADTHAVCIWLDRATKQQTASQVKLLELAGVHRFTRAQRRIWRRSLDAARFEALSVVRRFSVCTCRFEDLVERPSETAAAVADWLRGHGVAVVPGRMAECVLRRTSKCRPDLLIEAGLVAGGPGCALGFARAHPEVCL